MSTVPDPRKPQQPQEPPWVNPLGLVVSLLIFAVASYLIFGMFAGPQPKQISYTQFKQDVSQGKVASVQLKGGQVTGFNRQQQNKPAKAGPKRGAPPNEFQTYLPGISDPDLMPLLAKNNVTITAVPQTSSLWTAAIVNLLPWIFLIGLFVYMGRRMQREMSTGGGIFRFGKSNARKHIKGTSEVTFNDVAGLENAKRDLEEVVEYLKDPQRYQRVGAKLPRGVLLMGPPGTGKTLLAKAVAGEANVPFFSISGSEFVEMFVGVGASRVGDMFETAHKEEPAVIFIDEIDSVGRSRGAGLGGGNDEREQTLNQILSEMDGFSPWHATIVIAATNRPDVLDPALLRPGRFDRKIAMELPRKDARRKIMEIHTRRVTLARDVDLGRIARRTVGFSGADLENLINEAALLAGREHRPQVNMELLERARDRIVLGNKRDSMLDEEEKRRVAFHESGHALLACLLPHTDPLEKVSIIPRGRALGVTEQIPEEDRYTVSERYLKDRITVVLGGRVPEKLVFGETSSGAENDLQEATGLARRMMSRWGMSEKLGPVAFHRDEDQVFLGRKLTQPQDLSEHTARLIDEEVRHLMGDLEERAVHNLQEHRAELGALAQALVEHEILDAAEVRAIVEHHEVNVGPDYAHA